MLYSLTGTIAHIKENKVILQQACLSFELFCPQAATLSLQEQTTLLTYLHWNQEQGPTLFGFKEILDKEVFLAIIDCSGIGPKLGIAILEAMTAQDFLTIIAQEDIKALSSIKGLGNKKAEQLMLHLKNKVEKIISKHSVLDSMGTEKNKILAAFSDLHQTLTSLNYSPAEIKQTTTILRQEAAGKDMPFDLLLRKALILLAKK
jgi:Holliday junction DNA helicase RuvA